MLKNPLLTLLFAFVPGAGQMYQGYMKRGLSQVLVFALIIMVGAMFITPVLVLCGVAYMYSFFDALNLRAQMKNGIYPPDEFCLGLDHWQEGVELARRKNKLVGGGLVLVGVYMLYENFINPWVWYLSDWFGYDNPLVNIVRSLIQGLPNLAVGLVFVAAGVWLIRGGSSKDEKIGADKEPDYIPYDPEQ